MSKQLLFSITKKDFRVDGFSAGGKGGQHQNHCNTGVRVTHLASGAVGEGRDERSKGQNLKNAFKRCIDSKTFQLWLKLEVAARLKGYGEAAELVDKLMEPKNLKTEIVEDGEWVELKE